MVRFTTLNSILWLATAFASGREVPQRPSILPGPKQPYREIPLDTKRDPEKVCFVTPCGPGKNDARKIKAAFERCNDGGTVVLDKEYTVCSPLDLRFLKHIDIALTGKITLCPELDYWQENLFRFKFQDVSSWWAWGGEDIHLYGAGTGTIDANGQAWYDRAAVNGSTIRPTTFLTDGWHGGSITGIKMRHSPNWHNFIGNSSDLLISDLDLFSRSSSENFAKNLDGWDTFRSDNIVIQNSNINHDDDCVSFKPNSTHIIVQNLRCNGSHGVSVGSLGGDPGQVDIVSDIYVYNTTLSNSTVAARLKVWPGAEAKKRGDPTWVGGGGTGYVRNVTYDQITGINNDNAIQIDQCYGAINASECEKYPSGVVLTDVLFKNMVGTASGGDGRYGGSLVCGSEDSCDNIAAENVTWITKTGEPSQWRCRFMDLDQMDLDGEGCSPA